MKKKKAIFPLPLPLLSLVLACFLAASGCATDISTRSTQVKLVSAEQAHILEYDCQFVGNVIGSSHWYLFAAQKVAYNNALNELLDNAAEIGATHLFVNLGNYQDLRGEAYYCAYCELANGKPDRSKCLDADGALDYAKERDKCEAKGFTWITKALDRVTCEDRGGTWRADGDIMRVLPFTLSPVNQQK